MAKIYWIKKIPNEILKWFELNFKPNQGYTYKFYSYTGIDDKIYGCEVFKNGEFWHNATQASLDWFVKNQNKKLYK